MKINNKNFVKQVVSVCLLYLLTACAGLNTGPQEVAGSSKSAHNAPKSVEMNFKKGQLLSLIAIKTKAGAAAQSVRKRYTQSAFGLAQSHGLKAVGALSVNSVGAGTFKPSVISFFSWPTALAEERFKGQPQWAAIKATRPDGWDELRIHDVELTSDLTLRFDSHKTYTMATAWINPENPHAYDRYLSNIEPSVHASGGRFIYQMREPRFASLDPKLDAPERVTLVEWDSKTGLANFLKTTGYKTNSHYLRNGTTRFEFLTLSTPGG